MARIAMACIALLGLVGVLSCSTSKDKVDDTAGTGEVSEVVVGDTADASGAVETGEPVDSASELPGPDTCHPNCEGKECGDDGCGGTCGVCTVDFGCEEGTCKQIVCTPGEPEGVCLGPTTYSVCSPLGTAYEEAYCTAPYTCHQGQCVDGCEVGKKMCKGMTRVQEMVLNESGACQWIVVKDCSPGICSEGECMPPPCPVGAFETTYRFVTPTPHMGEVGELVNSFVVFSLDPASVLTSLVAEQLVEQLTGSASDICIEDLQAAFADATADWFLGNSPEMVQDLWILSYDLVGILSDVAFYAQTVFVEEPDGCKGTINWTGIEVANWGGVATWHFSLEDLAATATPIDMAKSTFVVEAATPQKLVMPPSSMSLDFGRVALLVLNEVLLVSVSELDDFEMLLLSVVDCQAIVAALPPDVLGCSGIESWELQVMCTTATDTMLESCMQAISNLESPSAIEVQGTCLQVDNDADGQADELSGGVLSGTVSSGWETGAAVQGQFEGCVL